MRDQNENIPRRINFLHLPHRPHRRLVIREQRPVRHGEERRIGSLRQRQPLEQRAGTDPPIQHLAARLLRITGQISRKGRRRGDGARER